MREIWDIGRSSAQSIKNHGGLKATIAASALQSLLSSVMRALHFVPALISIACCKWEQQQKKNHYADPILSFYCLLKSYYSFAARGKKNQLIAVNLSLGISLFMPFLLYFHRLTASLLRMESSQMQQPSPRAQQCADPKNCLFWISMKHRR